MKILVMATLCSVLATSKFSGEIPVAGIGTALEMASDYERIPPHEKEVLCRIIEAEATGQSIESKKNVCSVILNRSLDENFPNTISEVVFQKNQFSPISDKRYWKVNVTEDTIQAVDEVFEKGVTTEALFFVNLNNTSQKMKNWFKKLEYLFTDPSGHSFYK